MLWWTNIYSTQTRDRFMERSLWWSLFLQNLKDLLLNCLLQSDLTICKSGLMFLDHRRRNNNQYLDLCCSLKGSSWSWNSSALQTTYSHYSGEFVTYSTLFWSVCDLFHFILECLWFIPLYSGVFVIYSSLFWSVCDLFHYSGVFVTYSIILECLWATKTRLLSSNRINGLKWTESR